ncbi:hypothetical protein CP082626L3_0079 [Chlamydia psittaci 08-2626_L3]|nr:hypothetical protein CP082626L3_0079 [Chlamydia psittaci 08-2626_L3]
MSALNEAKPGELSIESLDFSKEAAFSATVRARPGVQQAKPDNPKK